MDFYSQSDKDRNLFSYGKELKLELDFLDNYYLIIFNETEDEIFYYFSESISPYIVKKSLKNIRNNIKSLLTYKE